MSKVDSSDDATVLSEREQRTTPVGDMKIGAVIARLRSQGWEELSREEDGEDGYVILRDEKGSRRVVTLVGDKDDPVAPAALNLIFGRGGS